MQVKEGKEEVHVCSCIDSSFASAGICLLVCSSLVRAAAVQLSFLLQDGCGRECSGAAQDV